MSKDLIGAAKASENINTMKGLVYEGPGEKKWTDVPKPVIKVPIDAVVRVLKTTIGGTDLHILKGDVPAVSKGRILGHEGVGIVEETGSAVNNFKKEDHILISFITSCGKCEYCKKQMYSHFEDRAFFSKSDKKHSMKPI